MARKSPLDDPRKAAFAWARYRRLMRLLFLFALGVVAIAFAIIYQGGQPVSAHFYIAVGLAITFTMLLTGALMGLVFLSNGTGHDKAVDDFDRDEGRGR